MIVAEACGGDEKEFKMDLLFGSSFHSRLERCVTNAPFVVLVITTAAVRQLFYQ